MTSHQMVSLCVVVYFLMIVSSAPSSGCEDSFNIFCLIEIRKDLKRCDDSFFQHSCRRTCGLCGECMDMRSDCFLAYCRNNVWKVQCRKTCSTCVQEVRGGGVGDETTTFTTSTPTTTWEDWSSWTCSVTCGRGRETRTRTCTPPGARCAGVASETRDCERPACCVPTHGQWNNWHGWSPCSRPCGEGTQTRSRTCNGPNDCGRPCQGRDSESRACNVEECPRAPAVPSITTDPQTSPFSAGVTVTLTCSSLDLGSPPATLTWDTARQGTRTSRVDDRTTRLVIPNLTVEDDGLSVKCLASNTVSHKQVSFVLRVDQNATFGECHVSASSATWEVTGYCDITKVFSSNNRYDCQLREIRGYITINIPSSFNLSPITPGSKLQRGKCGFLRKIPRDFPEQRELSRELKYQIYFNPGGTLSPITNVSVAFPKAPTLTCPYDVIMEGSYINCTCNTTDVGEPQGRLLLFVNNRLQHTGQYGQKVISLSRDAGREDNNARVSCLLHWARNMSADRVWTLRVMYSPEMPSLLIGSRTTVNYTTNVNNSVYFTCRVGPSNVESLELLKVTRNGSQVVKALNTSSPSFRIQKAGCGDSGIYYCRAGNTLAQTNSTSVQLSVLCSPEWASDTLATTTELKVTEGLEGQTTFELMASPVPTIDGFISHQEEINSSSQEKPVRSDLFTGKCEQKTPDLHLATCTVYVTRATPTDNGLYSVHVSNSMGDMTVTFQLRVIACRDNLTDCPSLTSRCGEHFVQEFCWKTCSGCRKQTSRSMDHSFLSLYLPLSLSLILSNSSVVINLLLSSFLSPLQYLFCLLFKQTQNESNIAKFYKKKEAPKKF